MATFHPRGCMNCSDELKRRVTERGRCNFLQWSSVLCVMCVLKVCTEKWYTAFYIESRDVPNIRFVFAPAPNSGPNSGFVLGRIVSSERIRIVSLYSAELVTPTANFTRSLPAALTQTV